MNIHEYQSKAIMKEYGIHVPEGYPAFTVEDAVLQRSVSAHRWWL